ncbi:MAG: hypothetical protein JWP97_2145 [Labilithrix sp.]|nr:hypothetical protein [Labilithrix sp.]
MSDNPFERYELDPTLGIAAITERLKELAEDARDDAERDRIRAAWEELTLHPGRRLRAALEAHPETRAPLGGPPPLPRVRRSLATLTFGDLAARPSALAALSFALAPAELRDAAATAAKAPPLDDDPEPPPRAGLVR